MDAKITFCERTGKVLSSMILNILITEYAYKTSGFPALSQSHTMSYRMSFLIKYVSFSEDDCFLIPHLYPNYR